jgi:alkylhydroperoxidase family enzyme
MITNIIIQAAERATGVTMDYLRFIAQHSRSGFWKFLRFMPLARYRRKLPPELWHAARIVATQVDDCGTCVQITVNLALKDGLPAPLLQALARGQDEKLPAEIRDTVMLVRASLAGDEPMATPLREALVQRHGEEGLAELALAVASARVFPTTKKVLGLAKSCSIVRVELPEG